MSANGDHPHSNDDANSSRDKTNRWEYARALIRCICDFFHWISESIRHPHNIPHYLTALFTLCLVIFAWYAWDESKRGTAALQGQTKALQEQLATLRAEPLPWVALSGIAPHNISPRPVAGSNFFLSVNWQNFEKNPAFHVKADFKFSLQKPKIPIPPCNYCGAGSVLLPGVPVGRTPHIEGAELTQDVANNIQAGKQKMWLVGRIDCNDGENIPHKTFLCFAFEWDGSFIECDIQGSNYAD